MEPCNSLHMIASSYFILCRKQSLVGLNSRELSRIDFADGAGRDWALGGQGENGESSTTPRSARSISTKSIRRLPLRVPQDFPTLVRIGDFHGTCDSLHGVSLCFAPCFVWFYNISHTRGPCPNTYLGEIFFKRKS
jgi:hypothetical protein